VQAGWANAIRTGGDLLGELTVNAKTSATNLTVGRNLSGNQDFRGSVSVNVGGAMLSSLYVGQDLTALAVKGDLAGEVLVDRTIGNVTALSMTQAAVVSGGNINSINVSGAVTNSLVQAGISAGPDEVFGSGDLGEQARMADLGSFTVRALTDSIVAAGGNINSFSSSGLVTHSSVSAGLVLDGAQIQTVLTDSTPLTYNADPALNEQNTARSDATLFKGTVNSARAGTSLAGFVGSAVTAGVSPGADGIFGTADDSVVASLTGGRSIIGSLSGGRDVNSVVLADAGTIGTILTYTVDGGGESLTNVNPLPGITPVTARPGTPEVITIGGTSFTVTVNGPSTASVDIYDVTAGDGLIDDLVIHGPTGNVDVKVVSTVTAGTPDFAIGRVLSDDNVQVNSFTFNGDLRGDGTIDPDLWIDLRIRKTD